MGVSKPCSLLIIVLMHFLLSDASSSAKTDSTELCHICHLQQPTRCENPNICQQNKCSS